MVLDRWCATLGTARVLAVVARELCALQLRAFALELGAVALAFVMLGAARGANGRGARWVALHAAWHVVSVLGGLYVLRREHQLGYHYHVG